MTEYDYSPEAARNYQNKLKGIGNWSRDVSHHTPVNPFEARSDRGDSDFYGKRSKSSKSRHGKSRSMSSPMPLHLQGHGQHPNSSSSSSEYGGPDRPPTPPRNVPTGYGYPPAPYGQQTFQPQQGGTWQTGYVSPPIPPYPQPAGPPAVISNITGQPLIPTFNPQRQAYEYREPSRHVSSSGHRSSKKRSKRRGSVPPGLSLGQMLPGVYPGGSPQPLLSPGGYPYSSSQPALSGMHLPSGHTSPASIQYSLPPHSAPVPQTSLQAQQQLAAQARYQQQQYQASRASSPPMLPVMTGVSVPMMHMQGYGQPMMSPPLVQPTNSYTGYPSAKTGYIAQGVGSLVSASVSTAQPWATVVMDSKRKEKDSGSSFFGRLTSGGKKKRR